MPDWPHYPRYVALGYAHYHDVPKALRNDRLPGGYNGLCIFCGRSALFGGVCPRKPSGKRLPKQGQP